MSQRNEVLGIILGFILVLVIHALALVALIFASSYLPYFNRDYNFFLIPASLGLWQIIYVIPLILFLKNKRRSDLMKGVIIGAVLTALLNGGCWVFLILPK